MRKLLNPSKQITIMPTDEPPADEEITSPDTHEQNPSQQQTDEISAELHHVDSFPQETIELVEETLIIEPPNLPGELLTISSGAEETASTSENFLADDATETTLHHLPLVPKEATALPEDLPEVVSIGPASPVDATPDHSPTLTALPEDPP